MASNTKLNFQRTFTNLIKLESKKFYTLSYSDLILPVELTSINFDITSKESLYQISLNDDGIYINTSNMISFFIVSFFNSDNYFYGLTIQSQQTSFANMDIYIAVVILELVIVLEIYILILPWEHQATEVDGL